MIAQHGARRPIALRRSGWAEAVAWGLARFGGRPNQVSVAGTVCAGLAGAGLVVGVHAGGAAHTALFLGAAALVPARLLCNLLDGMLAVECELGSPAGALFNELPDRLSDLALCVCAGYAAGTAFGTLGPALGWAAGALALLTAYVRALAGSLGATEDFGGPMAKQQRMWLLTAAAVAAALLPGRDATALLAALAVIAAGCAVTVVRRTVRTARELEVRR